MNAAAGAAAGAGGTTAPDEIVSLFGLKLADQTISAPAIPLPETLGGTRVTVTDSAGQARAAGLYFVSPGQINFVVPAATAPGMATISGGGRLGSTAIPEVRVIVAAAAPGIFTVSGDGTGVPAAQWIRVRADGSQSVEPVTAAGIRAGGDTIILVLYGTGIRNGGLVTATLGGRRSVVDYAGAQSESPGLDQVNVEVPADITGEVPVLLRVGGSPSNEVTVRLIG